MPRQGSRGPDGNARPNSRHVAARAGVSVGTVSNVLNRPDLVAPATREKVEAVMREMGFVRNASARQLRMGRSQTVGLLVLDIVGPYFTAVAKGVEQRMAEAGFVLMLCSSDRDPQTEERQLAQLEEHGVSGILIAPSTTNLAQVDGVRSRGTPVVLLDQPSPDAGRCSVAVDDVKGAAMAAHHLLEQGHRRIALINGPEHIQQAADRRRGLHQAVARAGLDVGDLVEEVVVPALVASEGEHAVGLLMSEQQPPTAIMCVNDLVALGALRGLHARGLRVPEDVALIGYDDVEFASVLAPALTSVRRPKHEFGRRAAELLLEEIDPGVGHSHQQVMFQPELIVRGSTDPSQGGTRRASNR
ncbi:LacI family DNA-binding transcriptional regulator [Ruania alkalisoli]|uniref:LacI family DNA-binding transcriptional regulator n=2 Tax=Ruania alkalisoli TaxID=2779775 RepID=A0A7M1SU66_9MICO|nr:LacI family DNA-binding transcriptional regulator [Ruania alkalisoli]QOR71118.1 LacI family DNA-binding transcriptional regulator [Ruania alkalisoli]